MLEHWSRVVVAVSGGKDSLTLLHLLKEIEDETHGSDLIAVTIDEGISGYRNEAVKIAVDASKKLKVEWKLVSFKDLYGTTMDEITSKARELGACSFCGVLRRRALNIVARDMNADRLATGHTLDDMAQSAFLNLLRGDMGRISALTPGGFNAPGFVRRIKPLCEIPEKETTLFTYLEGLEFQSITCPYSEEAMRSDVRAFLNEIETRRPGTLFTVYNTALKLIPKATIQQTLRTCSKCGESSVGDICRVCQLLDYHI